MKVRILQNNRFSEGWKVGDIVEMDREAAKIPLKEGSIELETKITPIFTGKLPETEMNNDELTYKCSVCGKTHKIDSKIGQKHLREINTDKKLTLKENATKNLKDFKEILDNLGIVFWLDGGTLLGAYRDKDFPEGDEDDIDLCSWIEYKSEDIIKEATKKGFTIHHIWETEYSFERNGSKIDLFFNMREKDNAYTYLYLGEKANKKMVIPLHFFELLDQIKFKGEMFWKPREIEEYLKLKYGKWQIKVSRKDYDCFNPEHNKVVVDL